MEKATEIISFIKKHDDVLFRFRDVRFFASNILHIGNSYYNQAVVYLKMPSNAPVILDVDEEEKQRFLRRFEKYHLENEKAEAVRLCNESRAKFYVVEIQSISSKG